MDEYVGEDGDAVAVAPLWRVGPFGRREAVLVAEVAEATADGEVAVDAAGPDEATGRSSAAGPPIVTATECTGVARVGAYDAQDFAGVSLPLLEHP